MASSPPSGQRNGHRSKSHPETLVFRQEVMVYIASANGHRRQVLSYRHLVLQATGLHVLLQQGIFTGKSQCRFRIAIKAVGACRQLSIYRKGHVKGIRRKSGVLCQHVLGYRQGIFHLQTSTLCFILPQLYLKQVIPRHDSSLYRSFHITQNACQLGFDFGQGFQLFFQYHYPPEILFRGEAYFIVGQVPLQAFHFHSYLGQLVSVHNLSAGEQRQGGTDSPCYSVLQHGHVHVRSQTHLHQSFICHETGSSRAHARKIIGKCLFLILLGHFQFIVCILHSHIVCQGSLNAFIQRIGFLSESPIHARPTYQ